MKDLAGSDPRAADTKQSVPGDTARLRKNYRLYQKIANATSATVIIHRIMSLLRLFSSAIVSEYTTSEIPVQVASRSPSSGHGFAASSLAPGESNDLPNVVAGVPVTLHAARSLSVQSLA